jgi:ATP-dependent Clp protease ATP-binding subunit ClpA
MGPAPTRCLNRAARGLTACHHGDMTEAPSGPRPTPRYQAVLASASSHAIALGHDYVGTEHLLLALLADPAAVATQVLEQFAPPPTMTRALLMQLAAEGYSTRRRPAGT